MIEPEFERKIKVQPQADIVGLLDSLGSEGSPQLFACEWIDNALEKTVFGAPTKVKIIFDEVDNRLIVINYSSTGMSLDKVKGLSKLGRGREEKVQGSFSGEHGIGGMSAFYN